MSQMTMLAVLTTCVGIAASAGIPAAKAQNEDPRIKRGLDVVSTLSGGKGQPVLDALRRDFPPLGDAVAGFALGDIFGRKEIDIRARQLAMMSAMAALGHLAYFKVHAGYALNAGVKPQELAEIVYLTTVTAGMPRAIDAAQALREVFAERGIALPLNPN
jgi:4-carboxymuconolactone decarboxylase